jgi:hypothetical protein
LKQKDKMNREIISNHFKYAINIFGRSVLLVCYFLKIIADAGCYRVTLSSNLQRDRGRKKRTSRAHTFYQSLGFKQHGWSFSYQLQPDSKGVDRANIKKKAIAIILQI